MARIRSTPVTVVGLSPPCAGAPWREGQNRQRVSLKVAPLPNPNALTGATR
jgi:hypothetical protein